MNTNTFQFFARLALTVLAAFFTPSSHALGDDVAQDGAACGSIYRAAPGDTLREIALRTQGAGDSQAIFEANRDILPSVSRIEIGDELLIPCADGAGPGDRSVVLASLAGAGSAVGDAVPGPTASGPAIMPGDGAIGLLTGSDFAPFVHPALPGGGMITELVRLAMSGAGQRQTIEIALVEDWSVHFDLLENGRFDLGFPWYRPDCSKAGNLGASMRRRCAEFDFSDPLYEVATGYYVRVGDPLAAATRYDQLAGKRLCRPANYFTFDLEQEGLVAPDVDLVIAPEAADCFIWLERGKVDVVTLGKTLAASGITRLDLDGKVAEIAALASVQTLHAVAAKTHPHGRAYLDLVNAGFAGLQASGRWFEVVSNQLGAFGVSIR